QYDAAILALGEALKTDPNNAEARAALQEAEKGRTAGTAQAAREKEEQDRLVKYRKFLETGRANLAAKRYDAAAQSLGEALKLKPGDPEATTALRELEKERGAASAALRDAQAREKKQAEFQ